MSPKQRTDLARRALEVIEVGNAPTLRTPEFTALAVAAAPKGKPSFDNERGRAFEALRDWLQGPCDYPMGETIRLLRVATA